MAITDVLGAGKTLEQAIDALHRTGIRKTPGVGSGWCTSALAEGVRWHPEAFGDGARQIRLAAVGPGDDLRAICMIFKHQERVFPTERHEAEVVWAQGVFVDQVDTLLVALNVSPSNSTTEWFLATAIID